MLVNRLLLVIFIASDDVGLLLLLCYTFENVFSNLRRNVGAAVTRTVLDGTKAFQVLGFLEYMVIFPLLILELVSSEMETLAQRLPCSLLSILEPSNIRPGKESSSPQYIPPSRSRLQVPVQGLNRIHPVYTLLGCSSYPISSDELLLIKVCKS